MRDFPFAEIEKKLGYAFENKDLLVEAFTHSSYAHLHKTRNNERLEYLGDSVLELIVTEWQFLQNDEASEGEMTRSRQKLVCKDALDSAVDGLKIWEHLLTEGKSLYNVGDKAKSSLFEAVIAAIYLDGGYEKAKAFVLEHGNLHFDVQSGNPIGDLKEFLDKMGEREPEEQWQKTGADNFPLFHCVLTALGETARGDGKTKREAKATAATRLLFELQRKYPPKESKKSKRK